MTSKKKRPGKGSAQVWIGLVHVRPAPGSDPFGGGQKGAYTNAVVLAEDATEFATLVQSALYQDDLTVVEIEDLFPEGQYRLEGRINAELEHLIHSLSGDCPVKFDLFDVYLNDDA